ncbi:MAG: hypothetical protein A2902_02825 [Elusimicrobia bacterium RIFCSPLOWO2_01_FULL_64_13]|nr:MAG: hypothetical protein A2902_02825 [Elusimicrobia bacterium RIFCSPLOWO2_01_FULL_64_13]
MKKITVIALAVLGPALLSPARAAEKNAERTVTVRVESSVSAEPDLAVINLHFSAYGWTVDRARRKADRLIKEFIEKLSQKDAGPAKVRVGETRLKPSYQFNRDMKTHVPSDFLVSRRVELEVRDLAKIARVMDASLSVGSFLLESARLTVEDRAGLEALAFGQALADGRAKAEKAAKAMGAELGGIASVRELETSVRDLDLIQGSDFAALAAKTLQPGEESAPEDRAGQEDEASPAAAGEGAFLLPDKKDLPGFISRPLPEVTRVQAASRLEITFSLR